MPVKKDLAKQKKLKPKKVRAVRGGRARQAPKKPNVNQVVNVYTDRAQPYTTDFKNQFRYGLGFVEPSAYNPFTTQTTQYVQPQSITESIKDIPPQELEAKQVFQPFQVPFGEPKKKLKIGEETKLTNVMRNPYASESEGSATPRLPRADKGKPRGSYKEKQVIEGRNIQNEYVMGVSSGGEAVGGGSQPVFMTSRIGGGY